MDPAEVSPAAAQVNTTDEFKPIKLPSDQVLCKCPQKCYERVSQLLRDNLYSKFEELETNSEQNEYLQSYIEMRSVFRRLWTQEERVGGRLQRRVSCKYKIPLDHRELKNAPPFLPLEEQQTTEVCQKAFMNIYRITEKRIRLQREKLIMKFRSKPAPVRPTLLEKIQNIEEWSPDRAKLEMFFGNQLWRPEYIGMATDSEFPLNEASLDPSSVDIYQNCN